MGLVPFPFLVKSEECRKLAETQEVSLIETFLCPRKEKYLGCRFEIRRKLSRRDSDTPHQQMPTCVRLRFTNRTYGP